MYKVIRSVDLQLSPGGAIKFEGARLGSMVSFFHVKAEPGTGATLHRHPYAETWVVRTGKVRFTVGGEDIEVDAGNIVVAGANIPHKFTNVGIERLEMICIHPSPQIIQELIEE